jgi:hypothetical protein
MNTSRRSFLISSLALILCATPLSAVEPPWPKMPSECLDDSWFTDHFTSLVRQSMESPTAQIEITERSKFGWRWMKGCPRLHTVVAFKFTAHSPVDNTDHSGSGLTVFVYDPASGRSEIMSPLDAAAAVKKGSKEHPLQQQQERDQQEEASK